MVLWSLDLPLSMVARAVQDEAETGIMNRDLVLVMQTKSQFLTESVHLPIVDVYLESGSTRGCTCASRLSLCC